MRKRNVRVEIYVGIRRRKNPATTDRVAGLRVAPSVGFEERRKGSLTHSTAVLVVLLGNQRPNVQQHSVNACADVTRTARPRRDSAGNP